MPTAKELKINLVDAIEHHLKSDANKSSLRCEVQRVTPLVIQFKVWEPGAAPRYLNVKVSEMM